MAGYFKAGVYVGNGSGARAISGVGFQPDYIWIKPLNGLDTVRGFIPGLTTSYHPMGDQNGLWVANNGSNGLSSVGADGFTVQSDLNANGTTFIWLVWRSVVNVSQRLDWTGNGAASRLISSTIGAQPQMVFHHHYWPGSGTGGALTSQPWVKGSLGSVQIQDFGTASNNKFSTANNSNLYNNVRVTDTNFSIGPFLNGSAVPYYAYEWANAVGLCKVGLYTGDGAANGSAIDLGFTPSAIMLNACDAVANGMLPAVFVGARSGSSPWTKFFTMPGPSESTDANGIITSGNNMQPPLSYNATGTVYSYVAWGEANADSGGSGGSTKGVGWSGVTRTWPSYSNVVTQQGLGGTSVPGVVAP